MLDGIGRVPCGSWAIGVSGGADSVALLTLLLQHRPDVRLHVVHLNHQTRGEESDGDARFVQELATRHGLQSTVALLDEVRPLLRDVPANRSSLFRAARLALFRRVVEQHDYRGVLLAHHADDVAETVLHRLLRGSSIAGLRGISETANVGGVLICRPLLEVRRSTLRQLLTTAGVTWREDSSNKSPKYTRNGLRAFLAGREDVTQALLSLASAASALSTWANAAAPALPADFPVTALRDLPDLLRTTAAARWLVRQGVPASEVRPDVIKRLLEMVDDAASPNVQVFPGALSVRRTAGTVRAAELQQRGRPPT